ncbi:MAG: asparagine--tRNA ligase [Cytophagales bacterium]|nr:asparagine--tRNA ligase [Cytophagales bacterium]
MSSPIHSLSQVLADASEGAWVEVQGWVRTLRESKGIFFLMIYDGSSAAHVQAVGDPNQFSLGELHTGVSLRISGVWTPSRGAKQAYDILIDKMEILGKCSPDEYPLQPKRHSLAFLREHVDLRVRTQTFGAIFRLRHHAACAIHDFFRERGFIHIHTPLLTHSDAEGAGETFQVTAPEKEDFFGRKIHLTVSGQLEAEMLMMGLGKVYNFAPSFRAENSNTPRHLAEFWMVEAEMAFHNLEDSVVCAENLLNSVLSYVLKHGASDLEILNAYHRHENKGSSKFRDLREKIERVLSDPFVLISYTEAFEILRKSAPQKKGKFVYPIDNWGVSLQTEHEKYLVEKHGHIPVIIRDYPKSAKPFYMSLNEDNKTVAGMDILFPEIGELIGGSQREEREDILRSRISEQNIPEESLSSYLNTRRFGTVPHSGFGLGFERFLQFLTGMSNIRDVIPFPRSPGSAA